MSNRITVLYIVPRRKISVFLCHEKIVPSVGDLVKVGGIMQVVRRRLFMPGNVMINSLIKRYPMRVRPELAPMKELPIDIVLICEDEVFNVDNLLNQDLI